MTEKKAAVTGTRIGIRLTDEEHRMLNELVARQYPEAERAHSMMIRRLIREAYKQEQKQS